MLEGDGRPTRAVFYSILVLLVLENDAGGVDRLHPAPSGAKKAQRCRQMFRNGLEAMDNNESSKFRNEYGKIQAVVDLLSPSLLLLEKYKKSVSAHCALQAYIVQPCQSCDSYG